MHLKLTVFCVRVWRNLLLEILLKRISFRNQGGNAFYSKFLTSLCLFLPKNGNITCYIRIKEGVYVLDISTETDAQKMPTK